MRQTLGMFCVLLFALIASEAAGQNERPNVILVMCDDLGWGDVGFNGSSIVHTPHLDDMARHSMKFNRFYAAAPVCSPTRGSALTGRHPFRYGVFTANRGHMKPEEITLAEVLKDNGYRTGHFGKWHLGTLTTQVKDSNRGKPGDRSHFSTPSENGFDVFFSTEAKVPTWDPMHRPADFQKGESLRFGWRSIDDLSESQPYGTRYWKGIEVAARDNLEGDDARVILDRAIPFIEESATQKQPFFAVIWFHTPHLPVVASERHRAMYADRPLQEQLYFGSITAMDEQIGRLRKALRDTGVAENTMLWFCSDNGPENRTPGSAGPFRGRKRSLYEGGVRVPALLEWPAKIASARSIDLPAVTSDYFPTTLDILGIESVDSKRPIDGVSLKGLIEGTMTKRPKPIGFQSAGMQTLSDNRFKLVVKDNGKTVELYDLIDDPSESKNLASDRPELVDRMKTELLQWQESCAASNRGEDYQSAANDR